MSESKRNVLKNITSLGLVQIANYVFPLISIPIISRIIGPDKFGVINYSATYMVYFSLLINYGFDLSATRTVAQDPSNETLRNKIYSEVFFTKLFLFVIAIVLFLISLVNIPLLNAEKLVSVFTFITCISLIFTQNWLFQGMQDLPKIAILNFISKLLFTFIILLIVKEKDDYIWQPLVTSVIQIIIALVAFFWSIKLYGLRLKRVKFIRIVHILIEEKMIFLSLVVINLYTATNTVILGLFKNAADVGFYTAGQRLIDVIKSVINIPLAQALFPFIGVAFSESMDKGLMIVRKLLPVIFLLTLFCSLVLIFVGPFFLRWFYGTAFAPSSTVFQILAFTPCIIALSNVFGVQIMLNLKMDNLFFKVTLAGAIVGVGLNIFMIQTFGYIGTAITALIIETFITLIMYINLRKRGIKPLDMKLFSPRHIKDMIIFIAGKIKK